MNKSDGIATVTITPSLTSTHIASLQVRYDIVSDDAKVLLQNAAPVAIEHPSPFELTLNIDSVVEQRLGIPLPVKSTVAKTRISRSQLWIEFTVPVAGLQVLAARPDAVFPIYMNRGYCALISFTNFRAESDLFNRTTPSLDHLPYVVPDSLPKLRVDTASWLAMHTTYLATMSGSEYKEYDKVRANKTLTMPGRL